MLLHHDDVMACKRIQRYSPFVREFTGDWCRWKIADWYSIWQHCINEPLKDSACGKVHNAKDSIRLLVSVMHTVLSSNIVSRRW